jgi:CDP-diacylglycerol--glycerol-3-phosphate 3-phosphatidyltransferase
MPNLNITRKTIAGSITTPVIRLLARTPITPNSLTWFGFCITAAAAVLVVTEHLVAAGVTLLIASLFDMLDGALARATGKTSRFGAILDSSLDRVCEAIILIALLAMYAGNAQVWESALCGIALLGSFMVSYVRARMEGLGIECTAGFFTRPERVILMVLGLLLSSISYALIIAVGLIALLSILSAGQRMIFAWRHTSAS